MPILFFLVVSLVPFYFFFFNDTATTEIYTLSLHDALPIYRPRLGVAHRASQRAPHARRGAGVGAGGSGGNRLAHPDRKSTRLNSSHLVISYAVFCLKKKKKKTQRHRHTTRCDQAHRQMQGS